MSKTKSLLSFALAATMLFSTVFVGANAEDATPKTGTLEIGTATVEVGEPTATVDFTLTFDEAVKSPHSLCTIVSDYELTKLAVKSVDGTVVADDENLAEGDDDLVSSATVKISNNGLNLAAKKVIFESGVDSNAPVVTTIVFTATFDTSAAVAGTSVVSAAIDATNYDENTFALTVNAGKIVVEAKHEAVTDWSYDADNHWHACVVDGCTDTYDVAAHEWGEGVETKPATETETGVMTYTCGVCPATKTEDIPVIEPECDHANAVTKFDATHHWTECECEVVTEKVEHNFIEETIVEAGEGVDGLKRYTCECGYVYDDRIPQTSSKLGGTLNESYTSGGTTVEGNLASVLDNRYSFTYDIRNSEFFEKAKSLGSSNSEFGFAAEISGNPYYFPKTTSTYNRFTVADLSFGQFDSEIKIYMYLKDKSTGEIFASDAIWVNPYVELKEMYVTGKFTTEAEEFAVEKYIDYSNIHNAIAESDFETYKASSTVAVDSGLGGTFNQSYTSGGTTVDGDLVSLLDNRYSFTYDIRSTEFFEKAKSLGSSNSEFGFAAEISGNPYYFPKTTSTYNRFTVADLSFGQFDSEIKIYMYLKDKSTGEIFASDYFTVVPGAAISERSDDDSALKTAYHDFKDAWAIAFAA